MVDEACRGVEPWCGKKWFETHEWRVLYEAREREMGAPQHQPRASERGPIRDTLDQKNFFVIVVLQHHNHSTL